MRTVLLPIALAGFVMLAGCGDGADEKAAEEQQPATAAEQAREPQPAAPVTESERETPPATAKAEKVEVHFVTPDDGARVKSPVRVELAADGVEVAPAGTMKEGTGHMHILVDTGFVETGEVIPSDERHIHYGDGSTTAELELAPGEHVLRLQFADGAHRALEGNQYRDMIRVIVE